MGRFTTEAKVGLFVLICLGFLAYMTLKVGKFRWGEERGYEVVAIFDSVAGLKLNVPVEVAGVEVGRVVEIGLERGRASVKMLMYPKVRLPADTQAIIRTRGVLGDKYIELVMGVKKRSLKSGDRIVDTISPPDVDQLLAKLGEISEDIRVVTKSLSQAIGGEAGAENIREILSNIRRLTSDLGRAVRDNQEQFKSIVTNLDRFSGDLRDISSENKESIGIILANIRVTTERLSETIRSVNEIAGKINRGEGVLGRLVSDETTATQLTETIASLRDISQRISRGEGTLGKLVTEEETLENLNETLSGITRVITRTEQFKTFLGYRGEYLSRDNELKSFVTLRIQPKEDKFYILGLVDDPAGKTERTTTKTTTTTASGAVSSIRTEDEAKTTQGELKFTAQIAKRYYDLVIRGGLIESTGGLGLDYLLLDESLKLSFEAFDFDPDERPHLKAWADYTFFKNLFVTVGWDDFMSNTGGDSFFVGGGIRFTDDDLKYLLGSTPIPTK